MYPPPKGNIVVKYKYMYKATYFFEMSVLFETGELNTYVYDSGGLYRRKYVQDKRQGENNDDHSRADGTILPCIATRV